MQQPCSCPAAFNRSECLTFFNPWHHRKPFDLTPQTLNMRELGQPAPPQTLNVPGKVWLLQKWPVPLVFTEVTPINSGGTYHHHVHTCFNLAGHHYHFDHFYLGLYGAGRGQAIVSLFEDGQLVGKALKGGTALGFGWNYGWPLKVYCKAGLLRYNYDVGHFDPERNSDASQPAFAWYTEKHAL